MMASLSTSWSPVYTTQMASGQRCWVALIAAHSTRSPPPPALLPSKSVMLIALARKLTRRDERSPLHPSNLYPASLHSVRYPLLHPPSPNHPRPNMRDLDCWSLLLLLADAHD